MNENITIIWIFISFIFGIIIIQLIISFREKSEPIEKYLNDLSSFTPSQIKGDVGRLHRYLLIKSLKNMKNYLGWGLLIILVFLVVSGSIVVWQSQDYFKTLFNNEKNKIELRSEAAVDSLLNINAEQQVQLTKLQTAVDSLTYCVSVIQIKYEQSEKLVNAKNNEIANYKTLINQQDKMITQYGIKK